VLTNKHKIIYKYLLSC